MVPRTSRTPKARGSARGTVHELPAEGRGYGVKQMDARKAAARDRPIVIPSDSDNGGSEDDDGSVEPVLPSLPRSSSGSAAEAGSRTWRASTTELPKTKRRPSVSRDNANLKSTTTKPMKKAGGHASGPSGLIDIDTATTSTSAPSKLLNDTTSTIKDMGSSPSQSVSSAKGPSLASHHTFNFPSTPTSSRGSGRAGSQKVSTANHNNSLPKSSPSIPSSLPPPAVKERIYSAPRPRKQPNIETGSKKLESFGFVSAASLLDETDVANRQSIAPTHMSKSQSTSKFKPHTLSKSIKQEGSSHVRPLGVRIENHQSVPQTTRNTVGAVTPVPKLKTEPIPMPTYPAMIQAHTSSLMLSPRTPENSKAVKKAASNLSSSIGTRGDPYSISSDSDSDDDYDHDIDTTSHNQGNSNNDSRSLTSLKSLSSFSKMNQNDAHEETASDVEAVLEQYPTWLNSPSPAQPRSWAMPSTTATTTTNATASIAKMAPPTWPNKRLRDTNGKKRNDKRRVRFISGDDDDAFSPSPLPPAKRLAILEESRYPQAARVANQFASFVEKLDAAPSNPRIEAPPTFSGEEFNSKKIKDKPLVMNAPSSSGRDLNKAKIKDSTLIITVSSDSESESDLDGMSDDKPNQRHPIKQEEGSSSTRMPQKREKGEEKKIMNAKVEIKHEKKKVETREKDKERGEKEKRNKKRIKTGERKEIRRRLRRSKVVGGEVVCRHRNRDRPNREIEANEQTP
ncbi:hypothetical protein RRF57_011237 [Xylaria bambusicola]|uniref:Uncharacterized protein n=1 Tax=Xylaria bambusicola TaxID=326684 RepID=A0AAN7V4D3_9PEZI